MTGLAVGTCAAVLGLLAAEGLGSRTGIRTAKPLASTGFVAVALAAGATQTPYGIALLVALGFSWLGDVCLLADAPSGVRHGLTSFLVAHLAYATAFVLRGTSAVAALAALTVLLLAAALALRWLVPRLPHRLRVPVVVYALVFSCAVALAIGTARPRIAAAALCFFVSDLAVARNRFVTEGFINKLWGVPLYYGGQLLFSLSIFD